MYTIFDFKIEVLDLKINGFNGVELVRNEPKSTFIPVSAVFQLCSKYKIQKDRTMQHLTFQYNTFQCHTFQCPKRVQAGPDWKTPFNTRKDIPGGHTMVTTKGILMVKQRAY